MKTLAPLSKWLLALSFALAAWALLPPAHAAGTTKTQPAKPAKETKSAARVIEMSVTEKGFEPEELKLKKDEPVVLRLTRKTEETCATEILIQDTSINVPLPMLKAVDVAYTPTKSGRIKFGCGMNKMIGGVLLVE